MLFDPLAQAVEHLTFNQGVRGSIPRWVTTRLSLDACSRPRFSFFFWLATRVLGWYLFGQRFPGWAWTHVRIWPRLFIFLLCSHHKQYLLLFIISDRVRTQFIYPTLCRSFCLCTHVLCRIFILIYCQYLLVHIFALNLFWVPAL